jgi:diketogulonate reductase-like aldo/keto reductase
MPMHRFGPTLRNVPVIGQGTWFIDEAERDEAMAALRLGLDLGLTHIDTAEYYGWGAAEEMVGEAIAGRRDDVFLVSKVVPDNASRSGTTEACERSLARLDTDRLDCYLLHWRGSYPLEDAFDAFERLRGAGKILSWGVSNFDVQDLEDAIAVAGEGRIACNQVLYNFTERAIEQRVLPWCETHGLAVVGYAPFGHGRFPGPHTPGGRVLAEIAAVHDATPRQVASSRGDLRCSRSPRLPRPSMRPKMPAPRTCGLAIRRSGGLTRPSRLNACRRLSPCFSRRIPRRGASAELNIR